MLKVRDNLRKYKGKIEKMKTQLKNDYSILSYEKSLNQFMNESIQLYRNSQQLNTKLCNNDLANIKREAENEENEILNLKQKIKISRPQLIISFTLTTGENVNINPTKIIKKMSHQTSKEGNKGKNRGYA